MTETEKNSKDMWTSVSAITEADDCLRHWWFHKRCKLPQDQRQATIFGDVHHAVCARFLEADDRGVDPKTGMPVVLYPESWMVMESRFEKDGPLYKVSDSEAALIKVLIQKAITDGVLVREPGRTVEREFETVIFTKGYVKVILKGFIDVDTPRGIEDHKTTKNRKYLLSKAKLKKSIQMMGYAYERYIQGHQGSIWLCHNGFVKDFDNPLVRKTDVEVLQIEVVEFFNDKILPTIKKMLKYYTEYPPTRLDKWRNIPPANNANQSCNHHYGKPCPYIMICSGLATIDQYLTKYGMSVTDITGKTETEHKEKGSQMNSLMDKVKAEQAAQAGAAAAQPAVEAAANEVVATAEQAAAVVEEPTSASPVTGGLTAMLARVQAGAAAAPVEAQPAPTEVAVAIAMTDKQVAPWYTFQDDEEACPACVDNEVLGFNSKTEPCLICVNRTLAAGRPGPEDYTVDVLDDGKLQFTLISTNETTTVQVANEPETAVVIQPVVEKPEAEQPVASIADTVKQAATAQTAGYVESIKEQSKELSSTPLATGGFALLIGCGYIKSYPGDAEIMYCDILLDVMLTEISETVGKHWSTVEHFALMQAVDAYVPSLIPVLAGQTVISAVPSKGSAHARLIDGLRLQARSIVYPFAG